MTSNAMGTKIAQIHCDEDIFDVFNSEKQASCTLNTVELISAKDACSLSPIVGLLVLSNCRKPGMKISVKAQSSHTDFLKDLLNTISESDQVKVRVLDSKPDEITDNKPIEATLTASALEYYRDTLKNHCDCFNRTLGLSSILTKTKLPRVARDVEKFLNKVKIASSNLIVNCNSYEKLAERVDTCIGQLMVAMHSNRLNDSNIKKLIKTSMEQVSHGTKTMKNLSSSLLLSHYPLFQVDKEFRKATGYPVTWFFDPSCYYNFSESYKDASDNLLEVTKLETSVIQPLFQWQSKVTV